MAEARVTRRLAAILAADVVGFSRLMEADEAGTLAALKSRRKKVLEPLVAKHAGRVFKITGDGVLVEFGSAVNAVQCAVELQQAFADANNDLTDDRHIVLRIGVNLGDVMVEGGDLYGDGVNIAARLEALAEPGGVLVTGSAHDQVTGKVKISFEDIGAQVLKNIAQPVRAYRVTDMPAVAAAAPMPNSDKPSIAVLPFTNMSGDPEQEYFSDGITEDIITELSRFRSLLVIARNSSFQYKGKSVDVRRVARELRVQYVVEGSVRKMANRIRITAQFIDTSTGSHLWSERYDRALDDLFAVQDEVVRTVAATLVGRLEQAAWERVKTRPTTDLRAYELYLRGLKHFVAWTPLDNRASRTLFTAAIDIERDYAAAHAALSEAVFRDWLNGWSDNPEADFTAFHELAIRSVQLDEEDSRTHAALGLACIYHGQWDRARLHLMRAVELNPSNTHALVCLARLELLTGNSQGAIERVQGATRLNPFGKYGWYLGQAYYVAGRYDDATAILRSLSEPTAMVWAWLAASQAMLGQDRAAGASLRAFHEAMKNSPLGQQLADGQGWRRFLLERWPFQKDGDLQNLLQGLRKAGLPE